MPGSIVELGAADIGEIVQQAGIGRCLADNAAQLAGGDPGVAILDMGKDVGDWATVDRQSQPFTGFQLGDNG